MLLTWLQVAEILFETPFILNMTDQSQTNKYKIELNYNTINSKYTPNLLLVILVIGK